MTADLVCAATDPAWQVRVQGGFLLHGKTPRWGYVITEPGKPTYVSPYRWHSAEAAFRAGEKDAATCLPN